MDYRKLIIAITFFFFGILSISYYFGLIAYTPNMAFALFWLALGVVLILIGVIYLKFGTKPLNYIPKQILFACTCFFIIVFSFFLIMEASIYHTGTYKDKKQTDYIIVLGAGLLGDRLTTSLILRLDAALEFHALYPEVPIIVSGGQGPDELLSEAQAMKNYLVEKA